MATFKESTTYKTLRAMAYAAVSAIIGAWLSYLTSHPDAFGAYSVAVNGALVVLKNTIIDPWLQSRTQDPAQPQ